MQNLIFTTNLVAPVFLIVALGYFLRRIGMITDNFVKLSSKIVFSVSLPALIFIELSTIDLHRVFNLNLIIFIYAGTIISFLLIWLIAAPLVKKPKDRTVFVQGAFRGNFAVIGLALIFNLYGESGLGKASITLAFTIPLYNILSVIILTVPLRKEKQLKISDMLFEIVKNPLMLAVTAAVIFSSTGFEMPYILNKTGSYLASLALPLALLGIGGFMSFRDVKVGISKTLFSTLIKLVFIPFATTFIAYEIGFTGIDLGILFILFACPTAIASFIMAEAMGSNSKLAANILLVTTLGSVISITLGLFILKENGLI
ncbi:MAG: transporter [Ignavibacteria bacterium CG2_30_36_16]|nr:AEC family transporter [Ignavibacteria bacterium]OIP60173.1 MAG: transporter [Ignavibacteria bacterium CG2_30_36_16]PJB01184.1 MAG: AEC family transporter [Ignavibacteria bacterium CG_4_9_14_3_um_filter_36_18]